MQSPLLLARLGCLAVLTCLCLGLATPNPPNPPEKAPEDPYPDFPLCNFKKEEPGLQLIFPEQKPQPQDELPPPAKPVMPPAVPNTCQCYFWDPVAMMAKPCPIVGTKCLPEIKEITKDFCEPADPVESDEWRKTEFKESICPKLNKNATAAACKPVQVPVLKSSLATLDAEDYPRQSVLRK